METAAKNPNNSCLEFSSDPVTLTAGADQAGTRLDKLIASVIAGYSRNTAARLIREGFVRVNDSLKKPGYRLLAGDTVTAVPAEPQQKCKFSPEPLDIDIIYKDRALVVVNKPAGLVVHPGAGHSSGTLAHGLIHHFPELSDVGTEPDRPGIIHRLDKDTSGVILIARTQAAAENLSAKFKAREIEKTYTALVHGSPEKNDGHIDLPIYRHPVYRKKMAAGGHSHKEARHAETFWCIIQRYENLAMLECRIKTGRTHQIRVHLSAIGHPVIGDRVYGVRHPGRRYQGNPVLGDSISRVSRQMLHAGNISFLHPETEKPMSFTAPLPRDMINFIESVRKCSNNKI